MTETMARLELNKFMSDDVPDEKLPSTSRPLKIGALIAIVLLIICYFASDFFINKQKAQILQELKTRQEITVVSKAEIVRTWIGQTGQRANQIVNNPLFRLFAAEINQAKTDDLPRALAEQLPYMQNAITSFTQESDVLSAYLVGANGRAYLASSGASGLSDQQRELAIAQYASKSITTSPLRVVGETLVYDFLIPVLPAQSADSAENAKVAGVLVMTVPASGQIAEILKPSRISTSGERTRFYQISNDNYFEITPTSPPFLAEQASELTNQKPRSFSAKQLEGEPDSVYGIGTIVQGTNWYILQGETERSAFAPLETYALVIYGIAASIFVVAMSVLVGIWLSLRSSNAKAMADQYRDFAHQINAQRRLLGSINNTIDDLISLTDASGRYVYANPALARFVNFPVQSIAGKSDRDLFGDVIARKLTDLNQQVMDTKETASRIVEMEIQGETRILRIEKSRLMDDDGQFMGIVSVAGDITDFIMHQRQKEELGRKTISILVHIMEENDPYLAGHSSRMSELSNAVAEIMELPEATKEAIRTGANLSQIGKISIPSEIRTKEGRLTEQEMEIMRGHVGKAKSVLSDMEIDQSVVTAVTHMYERLDGSGYPAQLSGAEIDMSGRILGITDILVARLSPRSYREAISTEEAMEVFRSNPEKYDQDVVVALDQFLTTPEGEAFKENVKEAAILE
ncbi:HD domain-containing phosphohydrolase [Sneathiella aquimaris]|uniref:HD domain-containing phosphohydrolase n=1 Tax=Sneathiella aquimaris TaxID=2599305 RepID=UPI00146A8003|nr:HD domain-containing phosphohydrolase [Sneathiella aquimaris]